MRHLWSDLYLFLQVFLGLCFHQGHFLSEQSGAFSQVGTLIDQVANDFWINLCVYLNYHHATVQ